MKTRVAGIVLLFSLVAPVAAVFTFLQVKKAQIRKEVKRQLIAGIDREELFLLKFTKKESRTRVRWEHAGEFEYDGRMYDVVETETRSDTVYYWCWLDREETWINKQLDKLVAFSLEKDPQQKEQRERLAYFYKSLYVEPFSGWSLYSPEKEEVTHRYSRACLIVSYSPPAPPPEAVACRV